MVSFDPIDVPVTVAVGHGEGFVDTARLSRLLQRDRRTIFDWVAAGCPHYTFGKHRRFRVSEVERWLARRPASESNAPIGFRRPKSGSAGQGDELERYRQRRMRAAKETE